MKLTDPETGLMDFESCRFDFRIDSKNGLTPSKRKKTERKNVNNFTLFKCKVCGCLFDSRPALLEHKICHNRFKCVFCEARFSRQTWMMEHVALVHGMGETATAPGTHGNGKHDSSATAAAARKPDDEDEACPTAATSTMATSSAHSDTDSEASRPSSRSPRLGTRGGDLSSPTLRSPPPPPLPPPPPPPKPHPSPLQPPPTLRAASPGLLMPDALSSPRPCDLPAPTDGLPVSPLAVGLPNPEHFIPAAPPSPQLPPPPPPMPPASALPCFYINVPILISSGSAVNTVPATSSAIAAAASSVSSSSNDNNSRDNVSSSSATASTSCLATPVANLLPVNPFPRKDIPRKQTDTLPPALVCPPYPDTIIGEARTMDDVTPPDRIQNAMTPGIVPGVKPIVVLPDAEQADQTEALDFSLKSDASKTDPDGGGGSGGQKPVFSLGIKDPGETLLSKSDPECEGAVDLSVRPPSSSEDGRINDDKVVMQQEYPRQIKKDPDNVSQEDNNNKPSSTSQPNVKSAFRAGTKRRSSFLDKMVQKLWQSKISRHQEPLAASTEENPEQPVRVKTEQPVDTLDNNNTSLGRVYVLNQLPEQIDAYAPGFGLGASNTDNGSTIDLSMKKEPETKESESSLPIEALSDSVLQTTAASISRTVLGDVVQKKSDDDRGFCAIKFHTCRVCKQLFYSAEEMWEHAVTHEDFHKYKCNQCAYVTACHRELVNHKLVNHGLDMQKHGRHICTYPGCMRSYADWRHLKEHQKVHERRDASPPKVCSGKGPTDSPLIGSPTKDGRLMCDYAGCYKTFKEWRHLKVHQTLHTGEKPLSCQLCSYACRHRSSMNWHMKSKHGLDKMKTQGNRTVYVDSNRRVVCGWSDEANREVNYLKEGHNHDGGTTCAGSGSEAQKLAKPDKDGASEYPGLATAEDMTVTPADGSTSVSSSSSRPPSCAPSDNPSERSLVDDPHMLMLKMQTKPSEFPLNMSVQVEDLSPKEQMVDIDGKIASKIAEESDKLSDHLTIDVSAEGGYDSANGTNSPGYEPSTVSSTVSSGDASSVVPSDGRTLVMTPVAMASLGQEGSEHQASMMKFKLKYLVAPKFFPCKVCNENFDSATKMWQHRISEHREATQFYCDSCAFYTDQMNELQGHMLSTHGKEMGGLKEHVCFICGKGYATRTGLNQHLLRHSEDGPPHYDCPYENCASKVHSKCALKNHIRRVHLKVPAKHRCPEDGCRRRFESASALRSHQALHTEHRPLVCDFNGCDKSFRESKHLKVHRMQHTDEKPIKCEMCDYSCRQRNSMNWHMKSKHNCEKSVSADGRTVYVPIKS